MEMFERTCLKDKGALIAHVANLRFAAMDVTQKMHNMLDRIEELNRAVVFEDVLVMQSVARRLRCDDEIASSPFPELCSDLISILNETTKKCSKAKLITM